jgi:hypothetical protein
MAEDVGFLDWNVVEQIVRGKCGTSGKRDVGDLVLLAFIDLISE